VTAQPTPCTMPIRRWIDDAATLVEVLRGRAAEAPERQVFTFAEEDGSETAISYSTLDRRARALAATLQDRALAGERALLVVPPGSDYLTAFFGCLYARTVAVPCFPPDPVQPKRALRNLRLLAEDAEPACVVTVRAVQGFAAAQPKPLPDLDRVPWIALDDISEEGARAWRDPGTDAEDLAFIQYTSGSTDRPKGVLLAHRQILHNLALIEEAFGLHAEDVGVSWLPPYHDMGLIGAVLGTVRTGLHTVLLSPITFLKNPYRWLSAISRHRATVSVAPNFAYELCVRKVRESDLESLDLSSWRLAASGAEPVRPDTLERFARTFACCGFDRRAFFPCYGLAEGTLIISGGRRGRGPVVRAFSLSALEKGRVREVAPGDSDARRLVACGTALGEQHLAVVDPEASKPRPPGEVGEIWVTGPSVAKGYWRSPEESARSFAAELTDGDGTRFLRTGDLGFLHEGQLFVAGRLKDLLVIRGRNHHPEDVEHTVEESVPGLRPGSGAAVGVEVAGEERLAIIQECTLDPANARRAIPAIRRAISERNGLRAHAVALVAPRSLLKTSSGKIRRRACRSAYLAGELPIVAEWCEAERGRRGA